MAFKPEEITRLRSLADEMAKLMKEAHQEQTSPTAHGDSGRPTVDHRARRRPALRSPD